MSADEKTSRAALRDIQSEKDTRGVPLQKVGVKGLHYPVTVRDKINKTQNTTATVDLFVDLPADCKGTHMSRFIEVFHKYRFDISMHRFFDMLDEIRSTLCAARAYGTVSFPFFIEKSAPVTGTKSMMSYMCAYEGSVGKTERDFFISVSVPVATLCPCSKAISDYGAHNQRGTVRVKLLYSDFFWIEDVIAVIENASSGGLYAALKRRDEKWVTEHAYDNPRFAEDIVRETYLALRSFQISKPFAWFSVEAENYESIHNHNAYACAEYGSQTE
ncbi:type I GTP cyclohydrolase folE2 [Treponema socranskii subsp. socranskii VPI DR56BR1116 = ATCC 35536]|uniref:GTP cyclohydrolase FolE2 n=1 Tax=Treponema socranskii subsp. socranskii VPI DR56BR1116 = ATCC 35536 TaxID=1125725 RepID=U2L6P7_TRESO|nr:GTP cyclohydrolase FolE2 [Treponema socranskii]ERF60915.1 type I GTP cyclohydrolase folE2 [Treponema socranskii subsp. socranskii VPI DR56BR1116 = ATCC 35536]ERK00173.1 type I GTP cyclohydrolase folE2 [Treponema socranskii subsp. socranskii VPI DR56BR1116 = ATCC 35536]